MQRMKHWPRQAEERLCFSAKRIVLCIRLELKVLSYFTINLGYKIRPDLVSNLVFMRCCTKSPLEVAGIKWIISKLIQLELTWMPWNWSQLTTVNKCGEILHPAWNEICFSFLIELRPLLAINKSLDEIAPFCSARSPFPTLKPSWIQRFNAVVQLGFDLASNWIQLTAISSIISNQ